MRGWVGWTHAFLQVAGGGTRAALTQHFAIQQNMGDVSAKVFFLHIFVFYSGGQLKDPLFSVSEPVKKC